MRKLLIAITLGLSLVLGMGGCGSFSVHDPAIVLTPVQKAQAAIDQVKAVVTSLNRSAVANRGAGIYTDLEWTNLKAKLNDAKVYIDQAQGYLDAGSTALSQGNLALANAVIGLIKSELIKRMQ